MRQQLAAPLLLYEFYCHSVRLLVGGRTEAQISERAHHRPVEFGVAAAFNYAHAAYNALLAHPEFDARGELIDAVLAAGADVVGHNIETVRRLTPQVRSRARYDTSLEVLRHISAAGVTAKSGLMVGLGESEDEVLETLADLHAAGCRIVTVGQYLQPTAAHWPVSEYVSPEKFEYYRCEAERIGFDLVASAPLVRSSYMAERAVELLNAGKAEMG